MQEVPYIPFSIIYKSENPLSTYHHHSETPYSSHLQNGDRLSTTYHRSITYHHPGKDNAGIQIKAHEQTEVSTGDNISFKAGNHSFMQVKL